MATRASELASVCWPVWMIRAEKWLAWNRLWLVRRHPKAICNFGKMIDEKSTKGINATLYQMMGHTAPVNVGVFLGVTGRIIPTSSACTSGSQGIGCV